MLDVGALPAAVAGTEGYVLDVAADGSSVVGEGPARLFHGLMLFVGLLDVGETATLLTEMVVHDAPRFECRGHQINLAWNFRSKEALRKTLDAMVLYKVRPHGGGALCPGTPSGPTPLTSFDFSLLPATAQRAAPGPNKQRGLAAGHPGA